MWAFETVFYQIYPLGFCDAPKEQDGILSHRLQKITDFIPHLSQLGVGAVLFNPLFESDAHGYDTRDFRKVDGRLGTNEEFAALCQALHEEGIKVILDGVFHHMGRGSFAFQDVLKNRENSPYKDWFYIHFDGSNDYGDNLWYEGWEGHYDLVKLNLQNPEVRKYLLDSVAMWMDEFGIDGLRLDVAYLLDRNYMGELRQFTTSKKEDFFLVGEMIGGDYRNIFGEGLCHSATNYECYKGLYSSLNSYNLFELVHSLLRQFGPEEWTLYKGAHLLSFADNHDVSRFASVLQNKNHILPGYALLFGMPGIPCLYYGSEWGMEGDKSQGDWSLRPAVEQGEWKEMTDEIQNLIRLRKQEKALQYGNFKSGYLQNKICAFERECDTEKVIVAVNISDQEETIHYPYYIKTVKNLMTGEDVSDFQHFSLKPYEFTYFKVVEY